MRGKRRFPNSQGSAERITPACAGKTYLLHRAGRCRGDHPRVCGENYISFHVLPVQIGSPPRVRGKLNVGHMDSWADRITPACAGKTLDGIRGALDS